MRIDKSIEQFEREIEYIREYKKAMITAAMTRVINNIKV